MKVPSDMAPTINPLEKNVMIFKSTFIATALAASTLFFAGTTESEARPRISFSVDTGGYHSGHGYNRGGYNRGGYSRGYAPRRPVYYGGSRGSYNRGGYSRGGYSRGGYRGGGCGY